jgi:hypothetical protein
VAPTGGVEISNAAFLKTLDLEDDFFGTFQVPSMPYFKGIGRGTGGAIIMPTVFVSRCRFRPTTYTLLQGSPL